MSSNALVWVEILFDVSYLIAVWTLVFLMWQHRARVAVASRPVATRAMAAFALLALGDTGHVGFRTVAYALGSLEARPVLFGWPVPLVGIGALATAITVTFFYVLMLDVWRLRFNKSYGWFEFVLLGAAAVRLVLMALPQNEWQSVQPPETWGVVRNVPLMVQGLGLAYLVLRDARATGDRTFLGIGISILVSYACYMPVIFYVNQMPMLGMLMMPKTLAYLAVAIIAYRDLYGRQPLRAYKLAAGER